MSTNPEPLPVEGDELAERIDALQRSIEWRRAGLLAQTLRKLNAWRDRTRSDADQESPDWKPPRPPNRTSYRGWKPDNSSSGCSARLTPPPPPRVSRPATGWPASWTARWPT